MEVVVEVVVVEEVVVMVGEIFGLRCHLKAKTLEKAPKPSPFLNYFSFFFLILRIMTKKINGWVG